jgi:hypothetical protein
VTPAQFQFLASAVYGPRWQSAFARDWAGARAGVVKNTLRNVQRWARDGVASAATAEAIRRYLEERRIARIAAAPDGSTPADVRDDACRAAVEPGLSALLAAGVDGGWAEPELLAVGLAAIVDRMRVGAGIPATIVTLRATVRALEAMRDT